MLLVSAFWGHMSESILCPVACFSYICTRYEWICVQERLYGRDGISEVSDHFPEGLRGSDQY